VILRKPAVTAMLTGVIDPDSANPPYEQVAVILRDEIARGTLSGRVPSIHAISQHHGVSHRTAARALSILKGEGKIISVPGQGHFVRADGLAALVRGLALAAQQRR
jgi:DNA-binding transcriptional regulator YhcF (GntR family)